MSKRTNYKRIERDFYRTLDPRAITPLLPHIKANTKFIEPCAGQGDLIKQLAKFDIDCVLASDIEPQAEGILRGDALNLKIDHLNADCVITNPMWRRDFLHAFILYYAPKIPTWLLFDADWAHAKQAEPFFHLCTDIVSVGRLKWFEADDPKQKGNDPMDNCAWYRFANDKWGATRFWGRKGG